MEGKHEAKCAVSLDPGLLVGDVPEELVQRVGLVQARAPVRGEVAHALEARVDGRAPRPDARAVELPRRHQRVRLAVHVCRPRTRLH